MNYASLFAGIGGFDLAFKRAKMRCKVQVEIDKNCLGVLAYHFPDVKRFEDVRNVGRNELGSVDLICGGFPCQDLSVAGHREGLAGERSGLWFEYHRIIADSRPRWVVIENVPGLLSSNGGKDFAVILRGLVECGYGVAWRILDAQYFGLAQRRRRVFIVGSLGDGCSAKVLFESEGVPWDSPPSRETGARVAPTIAGGFDGAGGGNRYGMNVETAESLVAFSAGQSSAAYGIAADENVTPPIRGGSSGTNQVPTIARSLTSRNERIDAETENFVVNAFNGYTGGADDNDAQAGHVIAFENHGRATGDISETIRAGSHGALPMVGIRRLTPTECERLQGFPDGWTAVNGQSDGVRYRQLGNAVAVPVVEWIGRRIMAVEL